MSVLHLLVVMVLAVGVLVPAAAVVVVWTLFPK